MATVTTSRPFVHIFCLLCNYRCMKRHTDHLIGRGSLAQHFEQGRLARQDYPRSAFGLHDSGRRDALALLAASNEGRIIELLPMRFGRMLARPFAFYRDAATLIAYDLARTLRFGVAVQLCGMRICPTLVCLQAPSGACCFD